MGFSASIEIIKRVTIFSHMMQMFANGKYDQPEKVNQYERPVYRDLEHLEHCAQPAT